MKQQRFIDIHEYLPVLIELLNEGREVNLLVSGSSMTPFLADGRDTIIISPPDAPFRRGDMVFYQRSNGDYIMHRIYYIDGNGALYIVGDGQTQIEGPVKPQQVFGIIRKVIRKGKLIDHTDFWWFFFEKLWIRMVPLRPFVCRIYAALKRK